MLVFLPLRAQVEIDGCPLEDSSSVTVEPTDTPTGTTANVLQSSSWRQPRSNRYFLAVRVTSWFDTLKEQKRSIFAFILSLIPLVVLLSTAWSDLPAAGHFTVVVTYIVMAALVRGVADPDICLFFGSTLLLVVQVITPAGKVYQMLLLLSYYSAVRNFICMCASVNCEIYHCSSWNGSLIVAWPLGASIGFHVMIKCFSMFDFV